MLNWKTIVLVALAYYVGKRAKQEPERPLDQVDVWRRANPALWGPS